MSLQLQDMVSGFVAPDGSLLRMRVGLHSGCATGGIVGTSMLRLASAF